MAYSDEDEDLFTADDMEAMKVKERNLLEKSKTGYYRCKELHEKLYISLIEVLSHYMSPDMLEMLRHN